MNPSNRSSKGLLLTKANSLDARADAGSVQARRRQAALVNVANGKGLPAKSATSAALMLQNNSDIKTELRVDIAEVREAIMENQWPAKVEVTNAEGNPITVTLTSAKEAQALLQTLEERLKSFSDTGETLQLELQQAMQKQQQAMQILSNIMKSQHDTAMAIIHNLRP